MRAAPRPVNSLGYSESRSVRLGVRGQLWPWLDGEGGRLPGGPAAGERPGSCPPRPLRLLRHTGAGLFARSSAVGDEPGQPREPESGGVSGCALGRQTDRAAGLMRALKVGAVRTDVEDRDRCAVLP